MAKYQLLFKYRSYTPIPFVVIMLLYANPNIWSLAAGLVFALLGEFIRFWGVSWAGSETRTTGSAGGTFLVTKGPFAFLRNPLYLGNIFIYTGLGVMSYAVFPWLQIAGFLFFAFQYHYIVKDEEEYLKTAFGNEYKNYVENVPRFFPRLTPYNSGNAAQPSFNSKGGLRSERRSLQALGIVAITIILIWFVRRF